MSATPAAEAPSSTPAADSSTAPTPSAAPAPAASGGPSPSAAASAAGQPAQPAAVPTPHPLDKLSQQELRIKLDGARRDLRMFIDRKKKIDRDLASLEGSIYAFEGSYLSDQLLGSTAPAGSNPNQFGNIIKGYDAYLKQQPAGADRKRGRVTEDARDGDRMFSRSSATYQKAVDIRNASEPVVDVLSSEDESTSGAGRKRNKRH